jgi:Holliday junction resolvase RusA-like endonuclease
VIVVELNGPPRGKGRPRFRIVTPRGGASFVSTYTDSETREFEARLRKVAVDVMQGRQPLSGALRVHVMAAMPIAPSWPKKKQELALCGMVKPTTYPDADNIFKVLDALNEVVWNDDKQIVQASLEKIYSEHPKLRVEVSELDLGLEA